MTMKKVLLPTDFSETALHGMVYGIQLLGNMPCEFYVLHAYNASDSVGVLISVLDLLEQEAQKALLVETQKLKEKFPNRELIFHHVVVPGNLSQAIKDFVEQKSIDLIVMGTEGATGVKEVFWGTRTTRLLREIKCPMLVVPSGFPYHSPKEILIALDQTIEHHMNGHFMPLEDIMRGFEPEYTFLNVKKPDEITEYTNLKPEWLKKYKNANKIVEYSDDVVNGIEKYITRWSTDMLVMVAHDYKFFESLFHKSLTRKMVMETSVPVLVLHD